MATSKSNSIIVAAVQIDCQPLRVKANLAHASHLVKEAASKGAQLVLLPELMPTGYLLTEEIWGCAEPLNGQITRWLRELAEKLGIFLGTSFLETEGTDFYNAFVLAAPVGEKIWRVRKAPPASLEAYFYRAGQDLHVLETPLGRIGIGICYENLRYDTLFAFHKAAVDLVLQPMAAGRPIPYKPGDIELFDQMVVTCAPYYANVLGVPVVMANRTGLISTDLPGEYPHFNSSFPGLSTIVDRDGSEIARMGDEEGFILAEVQIKPGHPPNRRPRRYKKVWAFPMPWYAGVWPQTQHEGERAYLDNERRPQCALAAHSKVA